jgi:DNA polymerase I-like protein with 3'-5' exonuclease and polymerase domains
MDFDFPHLRGPITLDTENHDPLLKVRGSGWPYRKDGQNGGKIIGVAVHCDNVHEYLPIGHAEGNLDPVKVKGYLSEELTKDDTQEKIFANCLYDMGWLKAEGIDISGPIHDVMFQAPLLDESRFDYSLDALGRDYLGERKDETALAIEAQRLGIKNTKKDNVKAHLMRIHPDIVGIYAKQDVALTRKLHDFFWPQIVEQQMEEVYQLEIDLVPMLIAMRMRGVRVDVDKCERLQREFLSEIAEKRDFIKDQTGITIGSWDAAAELAKLFDALGIEYGRTEKTSQPSITSDWMRGLGHPVADAVLRARKLSNMNGTFIENSFLNLQEGGRIYPSFNPLRKSDDQASGVIGKTLKSGTKGTVSGRFSSSDPNFQQIPSPEKDPELGYLVRSLVLPEEGEFWHGMDYSSQEPRGIVHFAEVTNCTRAREIADRFRANPATDLHDEVRQMVATAKEEWADPKFRKKAKTINLGLAYGMGGGKLAMGLGLEYFEASFQKGDKVFEYLKAGPEAQELLNLFDREVPFIKQLSRKCQGAVRRKGFIRTPIGRRFRFPKDEAGQYMFLNKALNRLIQGFSADMTKISLREMYRAGILPHGTVHDENDISSSDPKVVMMAKEIMETCVPMNVPILVDVGTGRNWGESSLPDVGGANYEKFLRGEL